MIEPWVVEDSKITYQDEWLKVRTDRCRSGRGRLIDPFHVLEYPAWVNVVALTPEGGVVLVEQYRHGVHKILRELPAGIVEKEDTPRSAAMRELREETGYEAAEWRDLGSMDANPATQTNKSWSFLAINANHVGRQQLDATEDIEVRVEPFLEFAERVIRGDIELQGLHLAGAHAAIWHIVRSQDEALAPLREGLLRYLSGR